MRIDKALAHPSLTPETTEIFLVYGTLHTGGIETLILRLTEHLEAAGFRTTVYCTPGGELQNSVNPKVAVVNYRDVPDLLSLAGGRPRRGGAGECVLILSFDATSAARAVLLDLALPKSLRVIHLTGVFHPNWYFMTGQPRDRIFLNEMLVHALGKNNIFFMNDECRQGHARKWKADLSFSPVIALPITQPEPVWRPRSVPGVRIVSVGRLVDFKAYNLGAARIVKACRDQGVDVSWDIYGYGPLEAEINALATALDVSQYVQLAGRLDYKNFSAVVAGFDLFVGMGTAVIEAAAVGVPSICAIVAEETRSYGFVSDLPYGNVGEVIEGRQMTEIEDLICAYAGTSEAERRELSSREVTAARRYGISGFVKSIFDMAETYSLAMSRTGRRLIAGFYYLMTEGPVARLLFGRGIKTRLVKLMRLDS